MYQRFILLAVVALMLNGSTAFAQCGCSSPPVYAPVASSYVSYYAPPVAYYSPTPYASYYAPPAAYTPVSYVSYYAPAAPYATYYSPYATYAPVVAPYRAYYGVAGWSVYGTPRVYAPGEPVRNVLMAVTP